MAAQEPRELGLILTLNGGAELVDLDTEGTIWASDSDDEYREEFPDFLDEEDVEHVLDYLVDHGHMSEAEADDADIVMESIPHGEEAAEAEADEVDDAEE